MKILKDPNDGVLSLIEQNDYLIDTLEWNIYQVVKKNI